MSDDKQEKSLNYNDSIFHARFTVIAFLACLGIYLIATFINEKNSFAFLLRILSLIAIIVFGWQAFFYWTTAISLKLCDPQRGYFQVAISILFPLCASLLFLRDTPEFRFDYLTDSFSSPWILIPLGIIAYFSYISGNHLDIYHPFRGFVISSTVLFVFFYIRSKGVYVETDNDLEGSSYFVDKDAAKHAATTGKYFLHYIASVMFSYAGLLLGRHKNRERINLLAFLWCRFVSGHRDVRIVLVLSQGQKVIYNCRSCGKMWAQYDPSIAAGEIKEKESIGSK